MTAMMAKSRRLGDVAVCGLLLAGGCRLHARPTVEDVEAQCHATSAKGKNVSTLLVEWAPEERTRLEAAFQSANAGGLAVRYNGCSLTVLEQCRSAGHYKTTMVTPKRSTQTFASRRELYAEVPLGAARIEAAAGRQRALTLDTLTVGERRLTGTSAAAGLQGEDCDGVTHVVRAVTVGAYALESIGKRSGRIGGGARGASAGVRGEKGSSYRAVEGDFEQCAAQATASCNAQLSLTLDAVEDPAVARSRRKCGRGMIFIEDRSGRVNVDWRAPERIGPTYQGGFCLDVEEVTTADYARCVRGERCMDLPETARAHDLDELGLMREEGGALCGGSHRSSSGSEPVNCVDWRAAKAYCESIGKRLPTSKEWRYAASGAGQGRTYPWGQDDPTARHVNGCQGECQRARYWPERAAPNVVTPRRDGFRGLAPGGRFPKGDGIRGFHDLAGNVAEWTSNGDALGGSFLSTVAADFRVDASLKPEAEARRPDVGFRCAMDAK